VASFFKKQLLPSVNGSRLSCWSETRAICPR